VCVACIACATVAAVDYQTSTSEREGARGAHGGTKKSEDTPDAGGVVAAYLAVQDWVRTFSPPPADEPAAALPIVGASGACVIVRHAGRVLGTGVDAGDEAPLFVRRATGRALSDALGDRLVAALPHAARAEVGRSLSVELEVAGPRTVLPGRTFAQIAAQVEPGLEGIAIRRGDAVAVLFPAQMRSMNTAGALERLLPALAVELGLPARDYASLRREFGIRAYRFRTIHLAQRGPGEPAFQTVRGHTVIRQQAVDRDAIVAFCHALARHIMQAAATAGAGDEDMAGMLGAYRPVSDTYEPLIASSRDQALCALALARYASVPGMNAEAAESARAAARRLLLTLAADDGETDPAVTAAAAVLACAALRDNALGPLAIERGQRVLSSLQPDGRFAGATAPIPPAAQAMLVAALGRLPDALRPESGTIRQAIDAAWSSVPEGGRAALLPWIGWAELDLAAGAPPERLEDLRLLREQLNATRIETGPADVRGGLALTTGGRSRPTAQTTRPAAWLATMLADERLTPAAEAPGERAAHLRTMRYVLQLAVGERDAWSLRTPARGLGGLRAATWDSTQPTAAQAMGLLAGVETVRSLDALAGRPTGQP
jgi:hypothetical protein